MKASRGQDECDFPEDVHVALGGEGGLAHDEMRPEREQNDRAQGLARSPQRPPTCSATRPAKHAPCIEQTNARDRIERMMAKKSTRGRHADNGAPTVVSPGRPCELTDDSRANDNGLRG
jgi:hypothetical protein